MDIILNSGRTIASAWAVLTYFRGNTNFGIYAKPLEERKNPSHPPMPQQRFGVLARYCW
jgi:hypothetical protein